MPKPVLQAMVLADHVYQDRQTGKHIVAGTFTTYFSAEVEKHEDETTGQTVVTTPISLPGTPYLYLALFEVHEHVRLDLKYVDLSDASVIFEGEINLTANSPIAVAEYVLPMPPKILTNPPGNYSLDLLYEGEILGQWRVTVMPSISKKNDGGEQ